MNAELGANCLKRNIISTLPFQSCYIPQDFPPRVQQPRPLYSAHPHLPSQPVVRLLIAQPDDLCYCSLGFGIVHLFHNPDDREIWHSNVLVVTKDCHKLQTWTFWVLGCISSGLSLTELVYVIRLLNICHQHRHDLNFPPHHHDPLGVDGAAPGLLAAELRHLALVPHLGSGWLLYVTIPNNLLILISLKSVPQVLYSVFVKVNQNNYKY